MATQSITKNIVFQDKISSRNLVTALEKAKRNTGRNVTIKQQCEEVKGNKIKQMFKIQ